MLVLVVDSSTPAVTAALAEVTDHGVVMRAQRQAVDAKAHGELLAPAVEAVLGEAGAAPRDLDAIVAGVGPGPFTGLRVGLVTAASMGQTLDIPTYGVCSLDALGRVDQAGRADQAGRSLDALGRVDRGGRVLAATDARRKEIYWAVYDRGARVTEPDVDLPAAVAERVAGLGVTGAVGEGALKYADVLGLPVRDEPRYPPAAALVELAAERIRAKGPGERLTPLYLRRPDAVAAAGRKPVLR
ncbi:tRNA (adenosine(37)-N6)-threonylcarbamoyltransferase complex dimerization subunit type 1 TsaB [Phytohabitans sp. LJ34]|uniref:tRNA (adenosine(37)-N6)-threonylcarbamoyltransferase complex dimerization subunit type 1 TsaB n=1 Tax=Phytohabitans sp. LJ34 TaxID=3452217 RepID=UPI003F8A5117